MHFNLGNDDDYELVVHSVPCTVCGGNISKCRGGMCNGSFGMGWRKKPTASRDDDRTGASPTAV